MPEDYIEIIHEIKASRNEVQDVSICSLVNLAITHVHDPLQHCEQFMFHTSLCCSTHGVVVVLDLLSLWFAGEF